MPATPILHFADTNMAGYEWSWTFFLNKTADGRFTVTAKQTMREDGPMRIPALRGLRDGVDVYEALSSIVAEAGYHLPDHDLEAIGGKIATVDPSLVSNFLAGEKLVEQRDEERADAARKDREARLSPFRSVIDTYVQRFNATPGRYGPSLRAAATHFIEEHVLSPRAPSNRRSPDPANELFGTGARLHVARMNLIAELAPNAARGASRSRAGAPRWQTLASA